MTASKCPVCGLEILREGNLTGKGIIKEGDIAYCLTCGQFLIGKNDQSLGVFSDEDMSRLKRDSPIGHALVIHARDKIKKELANAG